MKFGITVPNNWGISDAVEVLNTGPFFEELGYDSLWTMDHLFNIGYIGERLDNQPYYHPLATLSAISTITKTIQLGTSIIVLPYHNPIELAKYAATLDHFSKGRLILGLGVGSMVEEFAALGIPMSQRGTLTNENITIMKELWANEYPTFKSSTWSFENVRFSPKPYLKSSIPLWIGGASTGALTRVAKLGTGWHPSGILPEQYTSGKEQINRTLEKLDKDPSEIQYSIRLDVSPKNESANTRHTLSLNGSDPDQITTKLMEYQRVGADHVVFAISSSNITEIKTIAETISNKVFPRFK
jgi:probable F420-dependent oxidoreductase